MATPEPDDTPGAPVDVPRLEQFQRLLRQRGVDALMCPACGATEWGGFTDVGLNVLAGRNPATGEIDHIPGSVHALLAACGRCGYIALFDRDVLGE